MNPVNPADVADLLVRPQQLGTVNDEHTHGRHPCES